MGRLLFESVLVIVLAVLLYREGVRLTPKVPQDTASWVLDPSRNTWPFAMVTDLDLKSRDPQQFLWKAYLKKGTLRRLESGNYVVEWDERIELYSRSSTNNRSMELSALIKWGGMLLAACDYTGIVYKIRPESGAVFQRFALADGDGNEVKPFKSEWMTAKDGELYIGSMGKEWVTRTGEVLHSGAEWVKILDSNWRVRNEDWHKKYHALRRASNTTLPGYLIHEAVEWNARERRWYFLPRKASTDTPYDEESDQFQGTNLLLIAEEDFSKVDVRRIGPLNPLFGFTCLRFIPGTEHMIAVKVSEIGDETESLVTVFDADGNFFTGTEGNPFVFVAHDKYEGITFL